jgi:hypothetical protein
MSTLNNDLGPSITLTAAGAGTTTAPYDLNPTHRGCMVVINITAISGTSPTLTVSVMGHDPVSDTDFTILSSAALNSTGETVLTVYPGCIASANAVANSPIPNVWTVKAVVGGTGPSVTATISALTIV